MSGRLVLFDLDNTLLTGGLERCQEPFFAIGTMPGTDPRKRFLTPFFRGAED